jgi:type II restriction enzyme
MPAQLAEAYKSPAQRARVVTETWVSENMYCLVCESDALERLPTNVEVADFRCDGCDERYQLKSQRKPLRRRVLDSAAGPMRRAIRSGTVPNFLLMHYLGDVWRVADLLAVPGHFITESAIQERKPLAPTARRARWVGCYILLDRLPEDGRIPVISSGDVVPRDDVRKSWNQFAFLRGITPETRGWTADVLACVRKLGKQTFTLKEMYGFDTDLQRLHPDNRHVQDKIRQQLQILRDHGILRFSGGGTYELAW